MLSWISTDFFARSPLLGFPVTALFIFFTVFSLSALRAFFMDRDDLERMARLPLEREGESRHE